MANTYTQLYFHIIFAVKGRQNQIQVKINELDKKYNNFYYSNEMKEAATEWLHINRKQFYDTFKLRRCDIFKKMANTYTQLYFHIIFAVKGRQNQILVKWKDELYKYISGIITSKNQKMMIINGMPNHIHLLVGIKPNCNLSDLVREIKANSSKWINEKKFSKEKFEWQSGFGAFTVSQSVLPSVIKYIKNQEEHHRKKSFKEEYIEFLNAYNIDFKNEYLFDSQ